MKRYYSTHLCIGSALGMVEQIEKKTTLVVYKYEISHNANAQWEVHIWEAEKPKTNMAKEGLIILKENLVEARRSVVRAKDHGISEMYYHGKGDGLEKAIEGIDQILKEVK